MRVNKYSLHLHLSFLRDHVQHTGYTTFELHYVPYFMYYLTLKHTELHSHFVSYSIHYLIPSSWSRTAWYTTRLHYIHFDFLRFILRLLFDADGNNKNWWHTEYHWLFTFHTVLTIWLWWNMKETDYSLYLMFPFFVVTYSIRDKQHFQRRNYTFLVSFWDMNWLTISTWQHVAMVRCDLEQVQWPSIVDLINYWSYWIHQIGVSSNSTSVMSLVISATSLVVRAVGIDSIACKIFS